ncbi:MAG TPA: hypothetical protein VFL96_01980 [Acidobacteriaceae bacterium]|jgi:hypothetical protein|nr:hypothetical protein [Acidobacteriaceae bacterium]
MTDLLTPAMLWKAARLWREAAAETAVPGRRAAYETLARGYARLAEQQQVERKKSTPATTLDAD